MFADKLKQLMADLDLNQTQVSNLAGISVSSVSQYLSGKHEPSKPQRQKIANSLGIEEDYFERPFEKPKAAKIQPDGCYNLPVPVAARLMKKSEDFIRLGLQDQRFPWGYAVKLSKWSYYISSVKFQEFTGIEIPKEGD